MLLLPPRRRGNRAAARASLAPCDGNPYARGMGFHLVYGNDADALLDALAGRLRAPHPAAAALAPEIVLVPQFGLRRWLEIRLAEKLGIVANVEFAAPAEYAWRLLRAANPGLAPTSGYEREILRWRIFALLAPLAREAGFDAFAAALG